MMYPRFPYPVARPASSFIKGTYYTVRVAMKVDAVKTRCLDGQTLGNVFLHPQEVTTGTRMEMWHHDTATDMAYLRLTTGTAIRISADDLTPWTL